MYKSATGGSNIELYDVFDRPPIPENTQGHSYRFKVKMSFLKGNLYDKTDIDRERFMEKCAHFLNEHSIPLVKTVSALHFMYSALTQIILRVKRLCRASPSILQCLSDR